ncbi:MAG TPA: LysR substrate-binding domain-containing protein [Polyangiaceae bacterium]
MDLNRLAMFVRVAEAGSFTRAASALGLRKSSVSRGVTRLEEELGVLLLHRTTRSVRLTDAGHAYFDRVRDSLSGVEEATAQVLEMGSEPQGTVRVTAVPDFATNYVADIVARFVRRYPKIHVELVLTSRSIDLVEERIDIALRGGRLADSSFIARKILATDVELFAAPAYVKRRGKPKTLADLASHDCLLYRPEAGKSIWRLAGPHGNESVEVKGPISGDDMAFLQRAAVAGAGIGLLPSLNARKQVDRGELVHLLPGYAMTGGALYAVSPASRHGLARVRLLREFLVANLAKVWEP